MCIRDRVKTVPIAFVLFDVLYLDGKSLIDEPYTTRRQILEDLNLTAGQVQLTPSHTNRGEQLLNSARKNGLEGIVAKRLDSIYEVGRRSTNWLKIKIIQRQEFVIAGWTGESTGLAN